MRERKRKGEAGRGAAVVMGTNPEGTVSEKRGQRPGVGKSSKRYGAAICIRTRRRKK